jgi:TfuA protein
VFPNLNKIVFVGPTLNLEIAQKILDADFRPPAKKGDFFRLASLPQEKNIVGLIDGVFLHDYPPSPIEVYQLTLLRNFIVVGSSSLGALRAVELEKFGMIGVGKVFDFYKKRILFADDEVAVTYEQGENELQSEAMVDIRFNLFLAGRNGIIDENCRKILKIEAKKLYFPYRNYESIINICQKKYTTFHEQLEKFREYIIKNRDSIKTRDAIKLLRYFKTLSE